ncbi:MAG: polyphosphate kinase 1 [Bacteroidota bacterium]
MYYNRDLSWLEFNHRVLKEAGCDVVPLFERMKFLAIFYSNLNEFFSIRYPVILVISKIKTKTKVKAAGDVHPHPLEAIQKQVDEQLTEAGDILQQKLIPELAENGIVLYYNEPLKSVHVNEVREIFLSKVLSFVQPLFLDGHMTGRFTPEANKLYMVVSLKKKGEEEIRHTILKIPSDNLKRFFKLSPAEGKEHVIFIDDIIRENAHLIYPGFEIAGAYSVMMNRDADLDYEEDYAGNMLKKIEKQLAKRAEGRPSRFLCEPGMPVNLQLYISSLFGIDQEGLFTGLRYHKLSDLASFPTYNLPLEYEAQQPILQPGLIEGGDIFTAIEKNDILLHFPYHSYNPILTFFNQAAIDPDVNEIYITLYRVATDSLIANAMISAARNGKKVTVFIELKARFDEANNIHWSKKMKEAGIAIIYSIPGIKVHTKIALVTKHGSGGQKAYALISTGNFNELTARVYTDHTLLTANAAVTSELLLLFRFLEKRVKPDERNFIPFKTLLVSQFNMVRNFEFLIESEIKKVKAGGKGLIRIKMNNLEEPGMIDMLYRASRKGVDVKLIVRSICSLVPGVPELSERIAVKRLVDRYLEHTRLFIFGHDEDATVIIGSSDWMTRNLYRRIEACAPITDPESRQQLLHYFELQWNEGTGSCDDEETAGGKEHLHAQQSIYKYLKEGV